MSKYVADGADGAVCFPSHLSPPSGGDRAQSPVVCPNSIQGTASSDLCKGFHTWTASGPSFFLERVIGDNHFTEIDAPVPPVLEKLYLCSRGCRHSTGSLRDGFHRLAKA